MPTPPKITDLDYIQFLLAAQTTFTCTEPALDVTLSPTSNTVSAARTLEECIPDSDLDNYLLEAAGRGSLRAMQSLLAQGADINTCSATGHTTFLRGVRRGHGRAPALVWWLLAQGTDINASDRHGLTALHIAARLAAPETAEELLDAGADPNALVAGRSIAKLLFGAIWSRSFISWEHTPPAHV